MAGPPEGCAAEAAAAADSASGMRQFWFGARKRVDFLNFPLDNQGRIL